MKKVIIGLSLAVISSMTFAADLNAGAKTTVTNSTPATGVTAGNVSCDMVASTETATIQLSKDVVGSIDCTSTAAGIATAHPGGKGNVYGASSNGGKLSEAKQAAEFTNAAAAVGVTATQATAMKSAS